MIWRNRLLLLCLGSLWGATISCSEDELLPSAVRRDGGENGEGESDGGSSDGVAGGSNGNRNSGAEDASSNAADQHDAGDGAAASECTAVGDECTACINRACCNELRVCEQDILCLDILSCVINCEQGEDGLEVDSELCRGICGARDPVFAPSGANALAYADCRLTNCDELCVQDLGADAGELPL